MKTRLLIPVIALLIFSISACNAQNVTQVTSTENKEILQNDNKVLILDVRTASEFINGHIKNAINIDINQADAFSKIDKLDHNAKYIVHCRTNRRSKIAVDYMIQQKFKSVSQMSDGISGWLQNNFPVEK